MYKKRSDQIRQLLDSEQFTQSQLFHFVFKFDELAVDAQLDILPDLLVRVELRLEQRQEEQLEFAILVLDVLPHQGGLVHGVAIDHHEHRIRRTHHQTLQEGLEDRGGDGSIVQHETELAIASYRREHVEREAPARGRHHGRLSRRCPDRARVIVRSDTSLVGKEHRRIERSCLLFDGRKLLGFPLTHRLGVLLPGTIQRFLNRNAHSNNMTRLTEDRASAWPNWRLLRHLWCDRRQIEDLVANCLCLVHDHFALAQHTFRFGPAQDTYWSTCALGSIARKLPLCPGWSPTLRPLLGLAGREPRPPEASLDGGLEEVRELSLACSSSNCSRWRISCIRSHDSPMTVWHASTVAGRGGSVESGGVGFMLDSLPAREVGG